MAHCKDVENFQRILECPICLERIKDPRSLLCLHSFCEKCIGQHMDKKQTKGSFPCPICKLTFQVPQNGATGLKRNLYLIQISELFPEVSEVPCDVCKLGGAENTSTSMCVDCRDHLCQSCADYHCRSKFTHGHKVVSLAEIKDGQHIAEIRRLQKVYCPKHVDKVMEVYCENCETPMCYLCAMLEHKHHEIKNLEESAAAADDVIRASLDTWKTASDHSTALSVERKTVLDNLGQQEKRLIEEIEQLYKTFKDSIIAEIDVKKNNSIQLLKAEIATARKQAEVAYNEAEFSRMTITSILKYSQEILDSAKDAEKLLQFQDIKTRLANLDLQNLETEVIRPLFTLEPGTLQTIPDLTVKTVTTLENRRVISRVSENARQPDTDRGTSVTPSASEQARPYRSPTLLTRWFDAQKKESKTYRPRRKLGDW